MSANSFIYACATNIAPDVLFVTLLAVLLFPGFILNIPPIPAEPGRTSLWSRIFATGRVTTWNVVVHGIIFAIIYAIYRSSTGRKYGLCV